MTMNTFNEELSRQEKKHETEHLKNILHRMAEFIALYEAAEQKISAREKALEQQIEANEKFLNEQLNKINENVIRLKEIMTETGAARWRVAAEQALIDGQNHLNQLSNLNDEINQQLLQNCQHLEQISTRVNEGVNQAFNAFQPKEFIEVAKESTQLIQEASNTAVGRLIALSQRFYWRGALLALVVTLVVILFFGLYINNEWPWERHADVIKERQAGQILLKAWSHLSKNEQDYILEVSNNN